VPLLEPDASFLGDFAIEVDADYLTTTVLFSTILKEIRTPGRFPMIPPLQTLIGL
jgi:hypothetical protein